LGDYGGQIGPARADNERVPAAKRGSEKNNPRRVDFGPGTDKIDGSVDVLQLVGNGAHIARLAATFPPMPVVEAQHRVAGLRETFGVGG